MRQVIHNEFCDVNIIVAADFGQMNDPSAFVVVERILPVKKRPIYTVRAIERPPLRQDYHRQVERLVQIYKNVSRRLEVDYISLVIDHTGVGVAIGDMIVNAGLWPARINIHGGSNSTKSADGWSVAKIDLATTLQVVHQTDRLKIIKTLPLANVLLEEMMNFRPKMNINTGYVGFEALRENAHDDIVFALALSVFYGEKELDTYAEEEIEQKSNKIRFNTETSENGYDLDDVDDDDYGDGPSFFAK